MEGDSDGQKGFALVYGLQLCPALLHPFISGLFGNSCLSIRESNGPAGFKYGYWYKITKGLSETNLTVIVLSFFWNLVTL